jgi:hypothetical protein
VGAPQYHEKPPLLGAYYSWSGLPMKGRFETYLRPNRGFQDAERLATALDQTFSGKRPFDAAMEEYQRARRAAIHGNQPAMDAFVQMNAGTISPAEFFSPENVARIMAAGEIGAR